MLNRAISAINKSGALLIFPIKNKPEVPSLWNVFYPKKKMDWDWSENGNEAVPLIWHLREALSRSGEVVYTKFYQGRATAFSLDVYRSLLTPFSTLADPLIGLSEPARKVYRELLDDSPLPTKELRVRAELYEEDSASAIDKALRHLWQRMLICGYGEVEVGGFPSLAIGAVKVLFEDLWDESKKLSVGEATEQAARLLPQNSPFLKYYQRQVGRISN